MATPTRSGLRRGSTRVKDLTHAANGRTAVQPSRAKKPVALPAPASLVHELRSCVTEADIVQVLYRGLSSLFGYDVVNYFTDGKERKGSPDIKTDYKGVTFRFASALTSSGEVSGCRKEISAAPEGISSTSFSSGLRTLSSIPACE